MTLPRLQRFRSSVKPEEEERIEKLLVQNCHMLVNLSPRKGRSGFRLPEQLEKDYSVSQFQQKLKLFKKRAGPDSQLDLSNKLFWYAKTVVNFSVKIYMIDIKWENEDLENESHYPYRLHQRYLNLSCDSPHIPAKEDFSKWFQSWIHPSAKTSSSSPYPDSQDRGSSRSQTPSLILTIVDDIPIRSFLS